MVLPFWVWHLCTKFSFAKRTPSHSYVNVRIYCTNTLGLSDLPLYFPKPIFLSTRLAKRIPSHSCVGPAIRFSIKLTNKDFYQTWRPISLEILRCYIIKAFYIPEVIKVKLKNNKPKKGILQLESNYCWLIYNDCNNILSIKPYKLV